MPTRLSLSQLARRFKSSRRGNIAVMTSLLMVPIISAMGLALDYGNLLLVKSRLDQAALAAATAAANTARNVVQSANRTGSSYDQKTIDDSALIEGADIGGKIFNAQFGSLLNGEKDPAVVSVTRASNTFTAKVDYSARVYTYFMRVWSVNVLSLKGQRSIIIGMLDSPAQASVKGSVIDEQWIAPASSVQLGDPTKPVINDWFSGTAGSASPLQPGNGPKINNAPSDGIRVGNQDGSIAPIISKKVYLEKGDYELRYWYKSTVVYPEYEPVFICGSVEGEMHWATSSIIRSVGADPSLNPSTNYGGVTAAQTARAGVYLVPILTNPQLATTAPMASSLPKPPALPWTSANKRPENALNRIDICAYSSSWIERSISVTITDSGYFWLSFVAEPPQSTVQTVNGSTQSFINGFYLGRVQMCFKACSTTVNPNWPWSYKTPLFEADFQTNTYAGLGFSDKPNVFPNNAGNFFTSVNKYEVVPTWLSRAFGGLNSSSPLDTPPLFVFDNNDKTSLFPYFPMLIKSTRVGTYLYRRMLLTAGTYKATLTIGTGALRPPEGFYCQQGSSNVYLKSTNCICFVGAADTAVVHGDQVAATGMTTPVLDVKTTNKVNGYYGGSPQQTPGTSSGSDDSLDASAPGSILANCYNSFIPKTYDYCFLVPRTQYYGIQFRTAGPMIDTSLAQSGLSTNIKLAAYPELSASTPDLTMGTGGSRIYYLKIEALTAGVKNDPNLDFPTYSSDCQRSLGGRNQPTASNVMITGTPVWPGLVVPASAYGTGGKAPDRVIVTAPSN